VTDLDNLINPLTRLFAKPTHTMNPAMLALLVSLIEEAVAVTPGIVDDLKLIFNNPSPVPADWEALRTKVLAKSYADYVPASALPGGGAVPATPTASAATAASIPAIALVPPPAPAPEAAAAPTNVVKLSTPVPPPPGSAVAPVATAAPAAPAPGIDSSYKPAS
jgi:hypothetical protein